MNPLTGETKMPVVAILTYRDKSRIFRGNRDNFADLLRTASKEGVTAYIVAHDDLRLDSDKIKGYKYVGGKKKWATGEYPFPNVVYNRIPYRKFEQQPEVQRLIQDCLKRPDIQFFNPSFFSKWSLFQWLHGSKSTRQHIPETEKLSGIGGLTRMLRKHRVVYLKPVKGKAGKGIMKIQRLHTRKGATEYRLTYYQSGENTVSDRYANISRLYDAVTHHINGKEYIAQQGIDLVSSGGRPFDLRALVQKNSKGVWKISGVGARVAGASSITTHVPRGGSIDNPEKLLTGVFGASTSKRILKKAKATALMLASQIEKGSGHLLGEMSMDIGVDTSGKLWFFEANSKPMKFDEPHIRKLSLRRLVHYWKYLVHQPSSRADVQSQFPFQGHSHLRSKGRNG
ncbi:YheC/YheD family endospore coat-associated protein [Paenibacillus alkalitolerans]|uniref:YheC/YheD family endospore coat-associated protein n=1 Tax=Paenibacillus alkalitolerans TaxID=2799335 RepID=UPI0018F6D20A|nr:YheC/YheD family protein [Paenibacillus alkalitolerans]